MIGFIERVQEKFRILQGLLLIGSISVTIFSFYNLYNSGVLIDSYILRPPFSFYVEYGLWISVFVSAISNILIIIAIISFRQHKKISMILTTISGICLLCLVIVSILYNSFNQTRQKEANTLQEITLEEFSDLKTGTVYIGRPSCPQCKEIQPQLEARLAKSNRIILYYNTEQDRNERPEMVIDVLSEYGINSVPVIIILENGYPVQLFEGENIVDEYLLLSDF